MKHTRRPWTDEDTRRMVDYVESHPSRGVRIMTLARRLRRPPSTISRYIEKAGLHRDDKNRVVANGTRPKPKTEGKTDDPISEVMEWGHMRGALRKERGLLLDRIEKVEKALEALMELDGLGWDTPVERPAQKETMTELYRPLQTEAGGVRVKVEGGRGPAKRRRGGRQPGLTEEGRRQRQLRVIDMLAAGKTPEEAARETGVSRGYVYKLRNKVKPERSVKVVSEGGMVRERVAHGPALL